MKQIPGTTEVFDTIGSGGIVLALFLGIPALTLHLAWASGGGPFALLMASLLVGTACSAWRDLERGHVGRLSGSLAAASLVSVVYLVSTAL
ncbi:MAG: hypothetical protein QNK04_18315 [Myxococcota bacterium]|nr:hypothetical protein [Myxococcota bacterium]